MRKTLLIAAAALAASIISSEAQVYSQNIVGYVNQPAPGGLYTLVDVPLSASPTNNAEQVFSQLQTGDAVLLWNHITAQYGSYTYLSPGQWIYPDGSTIGVAPNVPPGTGCFFNPGNPETNTFTGTVVLSNTNTPIALTGGFYYLVGSLPPIGVTSLEDTNLNLPLQTGDAVLMWNPNTAQYGSYTFLSAGQWIQPDGSTIAPSPALPVGQGFFYNPGANETWSQNLNVQ